MSKFQRIYWSKKFDWKHYAKIYNKYCGSKDNYYSQSALELIKTIKLNNSSMVVDMACGTGALTQKLLVKYPKIKVFAVDLSKEAVGYYRKNFTKQIKTGQIKAVRGNAEKINDYTDKKYDAIFISSALWDVEIETAFKNMPKILKKNALVVFNLPALVVDKEKGFIFFIEHFFRQMFNSKMIYRRIKPDYLKKLFKKSNFRLIKTKKYLFGLSKRNVAQFFDLLRYRYPFILFSKKMPYKQKLKECTEAFNESLRYIPKDGINEEGFVFIVKRN